MSEKIHGENENNRGRDTGQNAATRIADSKRGCDAHDNETGPRQGEAILKIVCGTAREGLPGNRVEMQIFRSSGKLRNSARTFALPTERVFRSSARP